MNLKNARNMFKKTKNWKTYTQKTSHNDSELFWKNLTQYCFPTLISVQHYTENYKIQMSHNSNCVGHSVSAMALHGAGWSKCMDNSWFQFHPSSVATVLAGLICRPKNPVWTRRSQGVPQNLSQIDNTYQYYTLCHIFIYTCCFSMVVSEWGSWKLYV